MAVKLDKWLVAQKKHRLSDKHTMMARELGLNPDKLGKIDNHKQEPWKAPLPQFIEDIYFKRFKREEPLIVKSIKQLIAEEKVKKEKQKKEKEQNRKAKLQEDGSITDDKATENPIEHPNHTKKIRYNDIKPIARVQLEAGDTPETILQKEAHIFDEAFNLHEKESVTMSELGFMLKKIYPQYKPRRYGCKSLGEIYERLDKYEVIQAEEKGACNIVRKKEK